MRNNIEFKPITYSEKELEQIINLLKAGLNLDFTLKFFKWKHLENPFGKSYGLIAWQDDKIVGLRLFMRWEFINKSHHKIYKILRPVDTVVEKNYRGKGLFKKLTLMGIKHCEGDYDYIFNTPNNNSLPGYLKMGWEQLDTVDYFKVAIINPLKKSLNFQSLFADQINLNETSQQLSLSSTVCTQQFIYWRYKNQEYHAASFDIPGHYLIYKKSKIKGVPVFIIYEIIGQPNHVGQMLNSLGKKYAVPFLYFYCSYLLSDNYLLKTFQRTQPVVVIKEAERKLSKSLNFSLGDLEGKL